jgi:hypothetical protein
VKSLTQAIVLDPAGITFPTHTIDLRRMIVSRHRWFSSGRLHFCKSQSRIVVGGRPSKVLEVSPILVVYTLHLMSAPYMY